jgi:hypothetical protein
MTYRNSYRRAPNGSRTLPRVNKYAGTCDICKQEVPANEGMYLPRTASVRHREQRWIGSPVSGKWAGGCPSDN